MADDAPAPTSATERLAALLAGPPTRTKAEVTEAVYWPADGYAGAQKVASVPMAAAPVRTSAVLGYGRFPERNSGRIHVIKTTTEIWEVPAELAAALKAEHARNGG